MPGLDNNLYPPIFKKSYIPAFVDRCRIYFSLSPYNTESDIQKRAVQVIVQNQKTNQTVLNTTKYPSGIKLTNLVSVAGSEREDKYYIQLYGTDIQNGFHYNQYYKVQIRFATNKTSVPTNNKLDSWLNSNLSNFSQWSTVVLIKPISSPKIVLNDFNLNDSSVVSRITTDNLVIMGRVGPSSNTDYEKMKSYRLFLYDDKGLLLEDSKERYFYDSNEILYNCKYKLQSGEKYKLKIQVLTNNLYFIEKQTQFDVQYVPYSNFEATISAKMDKIEGCAVVTLKNNLMTELGTNVVIRRSSSKENFLYWEDMYTTLIPPNTFLNFVWKDYTVQYGVWYKYSVVKRNKNNFRSISIETNNPILADFEDIFLTTAEKQLKIRFNPQVTNYSRVVSESLVETIGSKYPFIRRNGKINYRTFSVSGTISYLSDINQNLMHSSKKELYGENASLYQNYNEENNINYYNDIIQEKEFREKVIDFLYDNNVKLYRSSTEGNLLVKLMNISLTPNITLGRRIFDFTCTVYEIDDFNYENCIKYKIQDQGAFVNETNFFIKRYGQLMFPCPDRYYKESNTSLKTTDSEYFGSNEILSKLITPKFQKLETDTIKIETSHLSYLRIQLTSPPYLINSSGNKISRATNSNNDNIICSGHIVNINQQPIVISADGIYQLIGDDVEVTSLSFEYPEEKGIIDFEVVLEESEKRNQADFKEYMSFEKIGQIWGEFDLRENISSRTIYSSIVDKYSFFDGSKEEQQVQRIKGLRITAEPGTVFYVRENQDRDYEKHILNDTGVLEFFDDNTNIIGIYFEKPKLKEITKEKLIADGLAKDEFFDTGEILTLDTIKNPKNNYVYHFSPINFKNKTLKISQNEIQSITEIIEYLQQNTNLSEIENPSIDDLYFNTIIQERLGLIWKTDKEKTEQRDSETLGLKYDSFDKYIFYNGSWYYIKPKEEDEEDDGTITIDVSNVEAIIDYYCDIIKRRY